MRAVWKFSARPRDSMQSMEMPGGAELVWTAPDPQHGLAVWAIVDTEAEIEPVSFYLGGTGWPVPEGVEYVGSCRDQAFVWHLFREVP